jgi:predicted GNAT family N-acyltransferase
MDLIIQRMPHERMEEALQLLRDVFFGEQNIPVELHPLPEHKKPVWWIALSDTEMVGVACGWIENGEWHWGRFAVPPRLRGSGIGKKLAVFSIREIFELGAEAIHIEARDVTVGILQKLGGKITGAPTDFHGDPVTPMILTKQDFTDRSDA